MKRALLALVVALAASLAGAQSGLPTSLTANVPGAAHYVVTDNGQCIFWFVYFDQFTPENQDGFELVAYCGVPSQMPLVGGRFNTIRFAANPLKSLQTFPSRVSGVTAIRCQRYSLTCRADDPALAPIVADLNAALVARP